MKLSIEHRTDYPKRINPFIIMKETERLFGAEFGSTLPNRKSPTPSQCAAAYVARCLTDWDLNELCDHFSRDVRSFNLLVYFIRDLFLKDPKSDICQKVLQLLDLFSEEV